MVSVVVKVVSGLVVTLFLGYCVYFDRVRHADPCFRKKLQARRQRERQRVNKKLIRCPTPPTNMQERQMFFLEQVSLGEQMMTTGNVDDSVCHFANAVTVCPNASQLLCVLKQTLPENIFIKLEARMAQLREEKC